MSLPERLQQLMSKHKFNNSSLANVIGVSRPTIANWINETSRPTGDSIVALAKALDTTPEYLITGKESPFTQVETWDSDTPLGDDEIEIPYFKDFLASCGVGTSNEQNGSEWRKLRFSKSTVRKNNVETPQAIKAFGDSMSPIINDGATVFIDTSKTRIKDGKMYCVEHGGLFKIKFLYALPMGAVKIKSANPDYEDDILSVDDITEQDFRVCGQVFSVSQMFAL